MPRRRTCISIDSELHRRAAEYATDNGFDFSELVSTLLRTELRTKAVAPLPPVPQRPTKKER